MSKLDKFFDEEPRVTTIGALFTPFMEVAPVQGGAIEYDIDTSPPSTHTSDGSLESTLAMEKS